MSSKNPLYSDLILDHYQHPRNYGRLDNYTHQAEEHNPVCGDEICLTARISAEEVVEEIRFEGRGCALCLAAASLMTELAMGQPARELVDFSKTVLSVFRKPEPEDSDWETLGDVVIFKDVRRFPARIKCVLMSWHALEGMLSPSPKR